MCTDQHQAGVSLVETLLFIVVVGVALAVLVNVFSMANRASVDPVMNRQSLAIAQALLEEIAFKAWANPSGGYSGPYNNTTRFRFDDVMDYNGFAMNGIRDLADNPVSGLERYQASVSVSGATFGNVPAGAGYRIRVTVTDPAGNDLVLDTYRANY